MEDHNEKITLTALLRRVWMKNPSVIELAKKTPSTFREFTDKTNKIVNTADILQILINPQRVNWRKAETHRDVRRGVNKRN